MRLQSSRGGFDDQILLFWRTPFSTGDGLMRRRMSPSPVENGDRQKSRIWSSKPPLELCKRILQRPLKTSLGVLLQISLTLGACSFGAWSVGGTSRYWA